MNISNIIESNSRDTERYISEMMTLQKNLSFLAQEDDQTSLKEAIERYLRMTGQLQVHLQEILAKVVEWETIQARRELYSERWWQRKRLALKEAFKDNPQNGWSQWLQTYTETLTAWKLAICQQLAHENFPFPSEVVDLLRRFREGTQAIKDENYGQALDMLAYLTQDNQQPSVEDEINRATLLAFMGRIHLYYTREEKTALQLFEQARELAPHDGLPYATLGCYYRLSSEETDRSRSLSFYQRAIELSPNKPDGYIGLGLLAENQAEWDEAGDWYEDAIDTIQEEKDPDGALRKLLAPISGNVYLQLARTLKKKDPSHALQAVDTAITLGVKYKGDYPERLGYRLKGEILEILEQPAKASYAFYEAAKRFNLCNEFSIADEILTHANQLDSDNASIYWTWSDVLRMRSYTTKYPYVDKAYITRSLETLNAGLALAVPDSNTSWVYILYALINEQLAYLPENNAWTSYWKSVAGLECAHLLNESGYTWAYLARFYRFAELEINALTASDKALALNAENMAALAALDERAAILANAGEFDEAKAIIKKRQALAKNAWVDAVEAYVLMRTHSVEEALAKLQMVLKEAPDDIWYHSQRATCYLMLNRPAEAKEDCAWVWSLHEQSTGHDFGAFAWAAYTLALVLLETNPHDVGSLLEKAIATFHKGLKKHKEKPAGVGEDYRFLGLSYFAKDDLEHGEEYFRTGIGKAINTRELDDVLDIDLPIFERLSQNWSSRPQLCKVLGKLKEEIEVKRVQLHQRPSAEEELKQIIEKYSQREGEKKWVGIGAHASLARLYTEEKHWREAAMTYQLLQKEGKDFPEAQIGLEKSFDGMQSEGDTLIKESKLKDAFEHYQSIDALKLLPDDRAREAQLNTRLGYASFALRNIDTSRTYFTTALRLYAESETPSPGIALGQTCRSLLHDAELYHQLADLWQAMAKETDQNGNFTVARESLGEPPR